MWREPSRTSQRSPTLESLGNKASRIYTLNLHISMAIFNFSILQLSKSFLGVSQHSWVLLRLVKASSPSVLAHGYPFNPFQGFSTSNPILSYRILSSHSKIFVIEWSCSHAIVLFFILHFAIVSFTPGSDNPAQEVTLGKSQLTTVPQELQGFWSVDFQTLADLDTYKTVHSKDEKARNSKVQTGLLSCPFWHFLKKLWQFDLASRCEFALQRSFWLSRQIYVYIWQYISNFVALTKFSVVKFSKALDAKAVRNLDENKGRTDLMQGSRLITFNKSTFDISQERAGSSAAFSSRRWE